MTFETNTDDSRQFTDFWGYSQWRAAYLWIYVPVSLPIVNVWGKRFKLPQLTHESFLTLHHSCKIFFWYLPNWTSTNLWCVVLYVTYSTTHQRSVEVQFGRYQKNILQEWSMVKKLSCVSCGSLKRFPHTFTSAHALHSSILAFSEYSLCAHNRR